MAYESSSKVLGKLSFPCDFTLKIVGLANPSFEGAAISIVRKHFPQMGEAAVRLTPSKEGKYLSLSITVKVNSQTELDNVYEELSSHKDIIFVL